jgi:hypothetical protein
MRPQPLPPPVPLHTWRLMKADIRQVVAAARFLVACPVFLSILAAMLVMDSAEVKAWSHKGVVCRRHLEHDAGNKVYAAVVLLMLDIGD